MIAFMKFADFTTVQPSFLVEDGVVLGYFYPLAQIDTTKRGAVYDFRNEEHCILVLKPSLEPMAESERMMRLVVEWFEGIGPDREVETGCDSGFDLEMLKDSARAYGRLPE